jgi:hypothetical protein
MRHILVTLKSKEQLMKKVKYKQVLGINSLTDTKKNTAENNKSGVLQAKQNKAQL